MLHIIVTLLSSSFGVIFHQPSASLRTFLKSLLSTAGYPDIVQHFPWQIECLLTHMYIERYAYTKTPHTNKVKETLKMWRVVGTACQKAFKQGVGIQRYITHPYIQHKCKAKHIPMILDVCEKLMECLVFGGWNGNSFQPNDTTWCNLHGG